MEVHYAHSSLSVFFQKLADWYELHPNGLEKDSADESEVENVDKGKEVCIRVMLSLVTYHACLMCTHVSYKHVHMPFGFNIV